MAMAFHRVSRESLFLQKGVGFLQNAHKRVLDFDCVRSELAWGLAILEPLK